MLCSLAVEYGTYFDEKAMKTLPVASVYLKPGGVNHSLRSAEEPVVADVSGFGPTDTSYFNLQTTQRTKRNRSDSNSVEDRDPNA